MMSRNAILCLALHLTTILQGNELQQRINDIEECLSNIKELCGLRHQLADFMLTCSQHSRSGHTFTHVAAIYDWFPVNDARREWLFLRGYDFITCR